MHHTPGPWEIEPYSENEWPGIRISARATDNCDAVAELVLTGDESYDSTVTQANAHLIAAAPELLEACRLLMRAEPMQQGERNGAIMGRISTAIDAARAALEKATGESK